MQRFTDQNYLTQDQYKDAGNLDARIAIHKQFSTNPQGWFNGFLTRCQIAADQNLGVGCGSGEMRRNGSRSLLAGVTLTDFSDGMLDAAWRTWCRWS
jgi:hypothetical protein